MKNQKLQKRRRFYRFSNDRNMKEIIVTSLKNFQNEVSYGDGKTFLVDEPTAVGGDDAGPDPYSLVLAGLGGCTSMTAMLYARRKNWRLERVRVRLSAERVHAEDCADCRTEANAFIHRINRVVEFDGDLCAEQIARLREIAMRCPVGKMLEPEIRIVDNFAE